MDRLRQAGRQKSATYMQLMSNKLTYENMLKLYQLLSNDEKKLGIYIHIPFCSAKCGYCGFYSKSGSSAAEQKDYVKTLIDDIKRYGKNLREQLSCRYDFHRRRNSVVLPPSCIRKF